MKRCLHCGKRIPEDDSICGDCLIAKWRGEL